MNKIWEKNFKKLVKKIYFIFGEKSKNKFSKMTKKNQKCCFLQKFFENESSAAQNPKNRKKYFFKFVIRKCQKSNFLDFFACQEMKISKIIFFELDFFIKKSHVPRQNTKINFQIIISTLITATFVDFFLIKFFDFWMKKCQNNEKKSWKKY